MSFDTSTSLGDNGDNKRKTKVAIHTIGVCKAMNPLEWPSGEFLEKTISEHLSESTKGTNYSTPIGTNYKSDTRYWQAAARYSLLSKYGYSVPLVSSSPPQLNEIQLVHQRWEEVVKQICRKQSLNAFDAVTNTIDRQDLDVNVITEQDDDDNRSSECHETASSIKSDFIDFIMNQCCISNNRQMEWSVMSCPPGVQFQLHAHPNIELIYCIRGTLYEIRMNGPPITRRFEKCRLENECETMTKCVGPELTYIQRSWSFGTLKASQWLVNEVGSIHKSFTSSRSDGGCDLLVLWGGSHVNILDPPITPNIQKAVDLMDERLKEECGTQINNELSCCETNGSTISATFLPESEKSGAI
jgi:hypothetical protein